MPTSTPTELMVSTRRGPIYFTTSLEWDEAVAELAILAEGGNEFALSLLMREKGNKYLSQSQVSWVYKLAQDALDERSLDAKVDSLSGETHETIDGNNILASLLNAASKGIKKPILRLKMSGENGGDVRIKYMTTGRNAGGAWVTLNSELVGKIDPAGEFTLRMDKGDNRAEGFVDFIKTTNANPMEAMVAYGKMTSKCGCCGLPLTNKKSIELGIGPICLGNFFGSTSV